MRFNRIVMFVSLIGLLAAVASAQQQNRPLSPAGSSATQVGGKWVQEKPDQPARYTGGKWIEVTYGRPIKRQRDLFGSGAEYGKKLLDGAPVWRAGANLTTRLRTDVPLEIGGKQLPAGDYALMVDLNEKQWTLILSSQKAQEKYDPNDKVLLFGSFNYDPKMDVLRAPMTLSKNSMSIDQLTIGFVDMTATGGTLGIWWDKEIATIPFTVAGS